MIFYYNTRIHSKNKVFLTKVSEKSFNNQVLSILWVTSHQFFFHRIEESVSPPNLGPTFLQDLHSYRSLQCLTLCYAQAKTKKYEADPIYISVYYISILHIYIWHFAGRYCRTVRQTERKTNKTSLDCRTAVRQTKGEISLDCRTAVRQTQRETSLDCRTAVRQTKRETSLDCRTAVRQTERDLCWSKQVPQTHTDIRRIYFIEDTLLVYTELIVNRRIYFIEDTQLVTTNSLQNAMSYSNHSKFNINEPQ